MKNHVLWKWVSYVSSSCTFCLWLCIFTKCKSLYVSWKQENENTLPVPPISVVCSYVAIVSHVLMFCSSLLVWQIITWLNGPPEFSSPLLSEVLGFDSLVSCIFSYSLSSVPVPSFASFCYTKIKYKKDNQIDSIWFNYTKNIWKKYIIWFY